MIHRQSIVLEWAIALTLAAIRTAVCFYRAATQSVTHDEAFSFLRFVNGPLETLWSPYDAANHVLYVALEKASVSLFWISDLSIRLPSVLAGGALCVGLFAVLTFCQSRVIRWTAYVALLLHPLLLDFSIAARGYGLAMALLVWAIYASMKQRRVLSGVLLGLGISANLTVLFPALALIVAQVFVTKEQRFRAAGVILATSAMVALAICYFPMQTADWQHFYVGTPTIEDSLFNLVYFSSLHATASDGWFGSIQSAGRIISYGIPVLAIVWSALLVYIRLTNQKDIARLTAPFALMIATGGVLTAHLAFGIPYPIDRTGLYLIVLGGLAWPPLAELAPGRGIRYAHVLLAAALTVQFATQFHTDTFPLWWYNNKTKEVAELIEQKTANSPPRSVSIGASFTQHPVLEYYRLSMHIRALAPIERTTPTELTGHDLYVLDSLDPDADSTSKMKIVFSDPDSGGIVLAIGSGTTE